MEPSPGGSDQPKPRLRSPLLVLKFLACVAIEYAIGLAAVWFEYPASRPTTIAQGAVLFVGVAALCVPTFWAGLWPLGREDLWTYSLWDETGCAPMVLLVVLPIAYTIVGAAILQQSVR